MVNIIEAGTLVIKVSIYLFNFNDIFLMIFSYDRFKIPKGRMKILSHMTQKACQSPLTIILKHLEGN